MVKRFSTSGPALLLLIVVLSGCGEGANSAGPAATETSLAAPTVTKTVTVAPTPKPTSMSTTGSYKADLAALGVVPDNVQSYAD
ncbi:hypothetical protein AAU01_09260 [Paenarthrobacter aurescens]|uniref:Lipoprotein n=1 Tax=Paenarthrobacter aurescens TaxID=43663 RepID=A0A4Y3NGK6_PAEAU|nr:hypothetical protein AAU01_09260 [Paenarthrobacter aurescens]